MAYVGNPLLNSNIVVDKFTAAGTNFTLSRVPGSANAILVLVGHVPQNPGIGYTVSGATLTLTESVAAVASGGPGVEVYHLAAAGVASVPADASVSFAKLDSALAARIPVSGQIAGLRNRIINGRFLVNERFTYRGGPVGAGVFTANNYHFLTDRFYAFCTGAALGGIGVVSTTTGKFQITGAAGVTSALIGQRIEFAHVLDMAGGNAVASVKMSSTVNTTVTWQIFQPSSTINGFGTLASPTRTLVASGTFAVTATEQKFSAGFAVPSTLRGLELVLSVGAFTSGTITFNEVQVESGTVATDFEDRSLALETLLCLRYYQTNMPLGVDEGVQLRTFFNPSQLAANAVGTAAGAVRIVHFFPVPMFKTPSISLQSGTAGGSTANSFDPGLAAAVRGADGFDNVGFEVQSTATASANVRYKIHFSADAEV